MLVLHGTHHTNYDMNYDHVIRSTEGRSRAGFLNTALREKLESLKTHALPLDAIGYAALYKTCAAQSRRSSLLAAQHQQQRARKM